MDNVQKVGRCQHCQQIRPVWHYDAKYDNGEDIWATPYPAEDWPWPGAWLCARDWSAAETARVNGLTFHVEHDLEVWFWREGQVRIFTPDGELLSQTERDLKTCEAILATTEETTS
ncbi:hypothetical protein [Streptomyces prasinus]|uniref:hypothetical protein n=1 Tax=Streptomyces prasinus TaxID=67345 RepID=UPI0036B1F572